MRRIILYILFLLSLLPPLKAQNRYVLENGWIKGYNMPRFNNRPIYLNNSNAFILAGDKPVFRFAKDSVLYGTFFLTYKHNKEEKPLYSFDEIQSFYKCGQMKWIVKDHLNPELEIGIGLIRAASANGAVIQVSAKGMKAGDSLSWKCGAKQIYSHQALSWIFDVMGHPELLDWGIDGKFVSDKQGQIGMSGEKNYITIVMKNSFGLDIITGNKDDYNKGLSTLSAFKKRLAIDTPDKSLDAMVEASLMAVDGTWYPPVFVHGCMQWNNRFPGWRTLFGGIMYGWHDRIMEEAKYYIQSQVTESDKTEAKTDTALLMTEQDKNSRFYGVGRIMKDQNFYDMQSQFFDQLVEEYRWNNSPEYVKFFRPALELHLKWMDECFDPDGDGLYESYINTWPTDSQWYNGGGTAEETSYAYRAYQAALDMAMAAGDSAAAKHHREKLELIRNGFANRLWLKDCGYSGAYREQGGLERVHKDPWLYSIFLPIDAHLTTPVQNIESLYYPQWALQNEVIPEAGRMIWTSNWVPGIWSVRELWPGDNYHLAMSYFQAGLSDEGWQILKGTLTHTGFYHLVPGNLGSPQGGIDFGDCVHPFARCVVSGLFGLNPDYPKSEVNISPSFPSNWNHASISIPDVSITFKKAKNEIDYEIILKRDASMNLNIPIQCKSVRAVTVNGKAVAYQCLPAVGRSVLKIKTASVKKALLRISYEVDRIIHKPLTMTLSANSITKIAIPDCNKILAINDPQGVFGKTTLSNNIVSCTVLNNIGFHTVIAEVLNGSCLQWRVLHLKIENKLQESEEADKNPSVNTMKGVSWETVDIAGQFNADIRMIYKQKYLSPRPNTVSVRLGTDGYSPWTFPHWKSKVPEIQLDSIGRYLQNNNLVVPQGIPFKWNSVDKNSAFVSLWDNYPNRISFDVNRRKGRFISFLVGGSTNVMQCHIENATISIRYEDGKTDTIRLVPPVNYWNLCPITSTATASGQGGRTYYTSLIDKFCMPKVFPETVNMGKNCTVMLINRRLRDDVGIESVSLECLSQEVVVGMMGISIGK